MKGNTEVKIELSKIKLKSIRFEGEPSQDELPKFRVVSGDPLKPMNPGDRVLEVVEYKEARALVDAIEKYMKNPTEDDVLKFRLSQWRELAIWRMGR